jgi:DNA-binding transcriptional LysR family regulator
MDTATLFVVNEVLAKGSIRGVARALGRPASSVDAAVVRLEERLSISLANRAGSGLTLTLEARRIGPLLEAAAECVQRLHKRPAHVAIGLEALGRISVVAQAGSIRRAAQQLGLGQPQLTRQMGAVERALETQIFLRSADGTRLTSAGMDVVLLSAELMDIWGSLSAQSGERFKRALSTARLGSVMPLGHESQIARMLAGLMATWQSEHRRQPLYISSTTADELLAGIKSGRFDAALLDTMELPADCEGVLIGTAPLALVGSEALFAGEPEMMALLARAPIAVPSARSGLRQQFDGLLRETLGEGAARALQIVEIDSIPVILNLVLEHGYLSLLPEGSIANVQASLGRRRLSGRQQKLWLCWPRTTSGRQIGKAIAGMLAP